MTRKEEIREAALSQRGGLLPVDDAQIIELIDYILELTAPESSPAPLCNHQFIQTDSQWKKCSLCGLIRPILESSAPLESQESLWNEFEDIYLKNLQEELPAYGDRLEAKSKFTLTRRTEGKQEELWKEAINNLNISELGSEENVLKELVSKWILIKRTANK